jgi:hypothetical protein
MKRRAGDQWMRMKNISGWCVYPYIWPCNKCWACISWLGAAIVIPGPERGPPIVRSIPPVDMLATFERLLGM